MDPDSPNRISAAEDLSPPLVNHDSSDEDFEFSFVSDSVPDVSADELFSNGRILPLYPLFNSDIYTDKPPVRIPLRKLLIEEREEWSRSDSVSSTSSSMDDLEGVPPETYCVWEPRGKWKKSGSTGSGSRRWRLKDLVKRSHSDGKEKMVFFPDEKNPPSKSPKGKATATEMDIVTAHRLYYSKSGERRLPYNRDLVGGFFGLGLTRPHNPF